WCSSWERAAGVRSPVSPPRATICSQASAAACGWTPTARSWTGCGTGSSLPGMTARTTPSSACCGSTPRTPRCGWTPTAWLRASRCCWASTRRRTIATRSARSTCAERALMARDLVVHTPEGLYCPPGDFHIDPWRPVPRAVITHGHGDHARTGMGTYHVAAEGLPVLQWRLGEQDYRVHALGERVRIGAALVSFHPAGHVLGSTQVRIEVDGEVWVASGDYKRDPDPTCLPFEVVPCDVFITECTFGLPVYRWPPAADVARDIEAWREECAANGEAAILYCYALGKAQRVLAELMAHTDRPAYVHGAIDAGVQVYRQAG